MNNVLLEEYDDENDSVIWLENEDFELDIEISNEDFLNKTNKFNYKFINNYTINIIKENDIYFVRITFDFKNDNTDEIYFIDLDINRETYLKIADELF